jgi:hypothetical protein
MTIACQSCRQWHQQILKSGGEPMVRTHMLNEQEAACGLEHAQEFAQRLR